jgi:neutral ceramidase
MILAFNTISFWRQMLEIRASRKEHFMRFRNSLAMLAVLNLASIAFAAQFRASVVETDITPTSPQWLLGYGARQSEGTHDRIFQRVAALDDGKTVVFLVSTEIALMSPGYSDEVTKDVEKQLGLSPNSIWWTVTHTHSAPEVGPPGVLGIFLPERYEQAAKTGVSNPEYTKFIEARLIESIRLARERLQPARIGLGIGFSSANINRRAVDEDGKIQLGMNPDRPVDRQIGVIRLETLDGKLIGLIANYPIHGTVLGGENRQISGDAPGVVAQYVEEKLGAPVLFINGAEGDVAPIYSQTTGFKLAHIGEFRALLGDKILEANRRMTGVTSDVTMVASNIVVETPLRKGLEWPPDLGRYVKKSVDGAPLVRIPVRFLQINHEAVLWGAPLEMFCEIAMDVRNSSRYPYTFFFGLTNGWLGYLPTGAGIREGGYEQSVSPFTDRGEGDFRDAVISHMAGFDH